MRVLVVALSLMGICLGAGAAARADEPAVDPVAGSLFPLGVRGLPGCYAKAAGGKKRRAAIERGLEWLAAHQSPNGGWECQDLTWCDGKQQASGPDGRGKAFYIPGVSGMALCAFFGAGYTHEGTHRFAPTIQRGLRWMLAVQDEGGCIGPRLGSQYVYNHAFGALALVEAYALSGDPRLREPARRALAFSEEARNPGWAWRYGIKPGDNDTSITGCMSVPLYVATQLNQAAAQADRVDPLPLDELAFAGVRAWIDRVTDMSYGRVGYVTRGTGPARARDLVDRFPGEQSEAMTAVAVFLRKVLPGWEPAATNDALIGKGAGLMLGLTPEWNPKTGRIDFYYWYYASMALRLIGDEAWAQWDAALAKTLLGAQRQDGDPCGVLGSWDPIGAWGLDGGRMYATALALLALETHDRMAPVPADRADLLDALGAKGLEDAQRARIVRALGLYGVPGAGSKVVAFVGRDDEALRAAAADALERLDAGARGTQSLGRLLDDERPGVRRAAARALVNQGRHLAPLVPALQARLEDADLEVAVSAARALGAAGEASAASVLRAKLGATDVRLRVAAAAALGRVAQEAALVLPVLTAGLGSEVVGAREEAAGALAAMGPGAAPAQAQLVKALGDEEAKVRLHAAAALWRMGMERDVAINAMTSALAARGVPTRLLAMEGLRAAGPAAAGATEALRAQLLTGPPRLRRSAARTLGAIGPGAAPAAATLYYAATRGDPEVRKAAGKACAALDLDPSRAVEFLLPHVEAGDPRLVEGATLGLADAGSAVVPLLVSELDPGQGPRSARVLEVLERMGPDAAASVPAVTELLATGPTVQLRCRAAAVLGAVGRAARGAVDVLRAASQDIHPPVRPAAVKALGRLAHSSDDAVGVLTDLLGSSKKEDVSLVVMAADGLGGVGAKAKPALPALLKLLAGRDGKPRQAAIRALGALVPHSLDGLRRLLREGGKKGREGAADAIAVAGPAAKKAVPDLLAAVSEVGRMTVIPNPYGLALASIGKPSVRPLTKLLAHKDIGVRAVAAHALGRIGPVARSALSALRKLARSSTPLASDQAQEAIELIQAGK